MRLPAAVRRLQPRVGDDGPALLVACHLEPAHVVAVQVVGRLPEAVAPAQQPLEEGLALRGGQVAAPDVYV